MLDGIPAPAAKVTTAAVGPGGEAHLLGDGQEFQSFFHLSAGGRGLFILARGVVTDQAVDPAGIGKIKGGILPAVSGMAAGAPAPVGSDGNSEVVEEIALPQVGVLFVPQHKGAGTLPQPVGTMENRLRSFFMAGDAVPGHG